MAINLGLLSAHHYRQTDGAVDTRKPLKPLIMKCLISVQHCLLLLADVCRLVNCLK